MLSQQLTPGLYYGRFLEHRPALPCLHGHWRSGFVECASSRGAKGSTRLGSGNGESRHAPALPPRAVGAPGMRCRQDVPLQEGRFRSLRCSQEADFRGEPGAQGARGLDGVPGARAENVPFVPVPGYTRPEGQGRSGGTGGNGGAGGRGQRGKRVEVVVKEVAPALNGRFLFKALVRDLDSSRTERFLLELGGGSLKVRAVGGAGGRGGQGAGEERACRGAWGCLLARGARAVTGGPGERAERGACRTSVVRRDRGDGRDARGNKGPRERHRRSASRRSQSPGSPSRNRD